jgi:hypothetical protein
LTCSSATTAIPGAAWHRSGRKPDARLLDTTDLTIEQAVNQVLEWSRQAMQ